ncbi:polysaccharide deacetylase family protein [Flavisolibacter nicotianae]|uniref:polysaccharide deacetylase family protein n=1 Tax=Flavisolibacter nicotianae TaxID=2364882 RepID=UPI001F0910F8|nr:polysaccharide deacetylase family protein [Flavisolibacter nicotianae]
MSLRILLLLLFAFQLGKAQTTDSTYAERLGFPKGAKVLILHVDDAGMSYDSNEGAVAALTKGVATSCSVMMPCPWVPAFLRFLKEHPSIDAGLHLTLTSEWKDYRWGPLAGKPAVPGLVDTAGDFWASVEEVAEHASAEEVDKEMRAQLQRAERMGFQPTHLDTHMGTVYATPVFLERYVRLGIEKKIPVMLPGGHATLIQAQTHFSNEQIQQIRNIGKLLWNAGLPVLDDLHNDSYGWKVPGAIAGDDKKLQAFKTQKYREAIRMLKPGITMMIMHCTAPTDVFPYISDSGPVRKGDLLAMLDPALKKAIQTEGIILTTWRELKQRRAQH